MALTRLADMINAPVFADAVRGRLGDAIRLAPLAYQESFEGQQAGTISVPRYTYIGDAVALAEGTPIDPRLLTSDTDALPIIKLAQAVNISAEAMKGAFGNPLQEAENQIVRSIANGIEREMFTALGGATLGYTTPAGVGLTGAGVMAGIALFGEEADDDNKSLVINPAQMATMRTDANFVDGQIFGCDLVVSNRVPAGFAYIVREGGLGLYMAKETEILVDEDVLAFTTVISAYNLFATHLRDESKVVEIAITA